MTSCENSKPKVNSLLSMKRFKFYTRNGKKFIRDYRREVKDGLNVLDLQKIENARLTNMLLNMTPSIYLSESAQ